MNNQVFALLITNGFFFADVSSLYDGSSIGKYGTGQTLSSLSGLFTRNLNNLADKYVRGIEIDFNVDAYQADANSDFAASVITTVGLGISKQLFNDRLRISATGNLDVEGFRQSNSNTTLMGNFILEYALTPKGQYVLRVYRTDHHDTLIGEKSSKNGIGIVIKKSFDDRSH